MSEADEALRREERSRAHRAKTFLEDPLVKDAFATLEEAIDRRWKSAKGDQEVLNAWWAWQFYKNFRAVFEKLIKTGELAEQQLFDFEAEREKRKARWPFGA